MELLMSMFVSTISGHNGQSVPDSAVLKPGQWISEGTQGFSRRKGVYMGTVISDGNHVVIWDVGQPRPELRHQMMVARAFVVSSNQPGRTRSGLMQSLFKLFS